MLLFRLFEEQTRSFDVSLNGGSAPRLGDTLYVIILSHNHIRIRRHGRVLTTVELRLSGLIGTASHPDMQKIRIIGFLFEIFLI